MAVLEGNAAGAPASVPSVPETGPVRFTGEARAYWRILARGAVLLAVTLGIYRFWLATDVRRYLWGHTEVKGDSLEYAGTALELLLGFLIAIALLVPLYVGFFLLALSLGPIGQAASVLGFPVLAFLGQFAVYRARRYRLTRTVFRGVRFHQDGSALRYAVCAMFWWVMIGLTLGLAYPFAQANLERFKMEHTYFGNVVGHFAGSGFRLFLRGLAMWLLVMGPLVFALMVATAMIDWDVVAEIADRGGDDIRGRIEGANPGFYDAIVIAITAVIVSLVTAALLFPAFQAMMMRWWLSGLQLGGMTVRSRLRMRQIYGAYLRFLLWGLLFLVAAFGVAVLGSIIFYAVFGSSESMAAEIAGALGAVALYVVVMLGFSAIYQATVKLALWRHGAESVELQGTALLDHVKAAGAPGSAVGEGLADALNVGGL